MIKISTEVTIDRSVSEVFDYIANQENDAHWQPSVVGVKVTPAGALHKGSQVVESRKFLGRRVSRTEDVVEYEKDRLIKFKDEGKVPVETTYSFERSGSGTKVTFELDMNASPFFKLGKPTVERMIIRETETAFAHLKDILEAHSDAHEAMKAAPAHQHV